MGAPREGGRLWHYTPSPMPLFPVNLAEPREQVQRSMSEPAQHGSSGLVQYSKLHWDSARGDAGGGIGDGGGGGRVPAAGLTTRATRARCRKTDIGT